MIRRFRQVMEDADGRECEFWCVAFESEAARELALGSAIAHEMSRPMPSGSDCGEPRPRGRPSKDALIAAAVSALGDEVGEELPLAERRRRVLRYLAAAETDPADIPGRTTVEKYLAGHPVARKSAKK